MSWNQALQLPPDEFSWVQNTYGDQFPIEVQHCLAGWIEERIQQWKDIDPKNANHSQYAQSLVSELIQEVEKKGQSFANNPDLFLVGMRLSEAAMSFKSQYLNSNPLGLVAIIQHWLNVKYNFQANDTLLPGAIPPATSMATEPDREITENLRVLHLQMQETENSLKILKKEQESFALQYHDCTRINAHLSHVQGQERTEETLRVEQNLKKEKEQREQHLTKKITELVHLRTALAEKHKGTIDCLSRLQQRILDKELCNWKREQQIHGNGKPFNSKKLDLIQEWCEALAEIIWNIRHQIKESERLQGEMQIPASGIVDMLPALSTQINHLLSSLVSSTFVIEEQPPQVLKKDKRFTAKIRLLVGGKLNVNMTSPRVQVSIINEAQANVLMNNGKISKDKQAGKILNNIATMECNQVTRYLLASFGSMQLTSIKRTEKKGAESVMDEKFALLFQSQFSVGGGELVFPVWRLSLPVVVIVQSSQEPQAWATVSWDNAFAEPSRTLFSVPEMVPWPHIADILDTKFIAATGRGLTEDNLNFLAGKAFRCSQDLDFSTMKLSWSQFCKEPHSDRSERNFTFWEWFYAALKVTKEYMCQQWKDGSIIGFVSRQQAEEMLLQSCEPHTFLLRFSDSELGGVTIAWMAEDATTGGRNVFMVQPFTSKDFAIIPLPDIINDLSYLRYLYPNVLKDDAFGQYYATQEKQKSSNRNGYVHIRKKAYVPGFSHSCSNTQQIGNGMHGCSLASPHISDCVSRSPVNGIEFDQIITEAHNPSWTPLSLENAELHETYLGDNSLGGNLL